jgi:hypothetical protein
MNKIMTDKMNDSEAKLEACFQRHLNNLTPGTPLWHQYEALKAEVKTEVLGIPVLAKDTIPKVQPMEQMYETPTTKGEE